MKATILLISIATIGLLNAGSANPPKIETTVAVDGVYVTYGWHNMVIELKGNKCRYWFSSDSKGFDVEGLEGECSIEGDKVWLVHPKIDPLVSQWTARRIDGVVTLWRSDAIKQLKEGKLDLYLMGKENFFRTGGGGILVPSKKNAEEAWKSPQVVVLTEAENKALIERQKTNTEGGSVHPATRSQSKSEGSDKPQPEAEGRSR